MNTTELKKLAEQCICHSLSRSTTEVENSGEAILSLLALNAELVEALKLISDTDPVDAALDPQRSVRVARAALAKAEGGEL